MSDFIYIAATDNLTRIGVAREYPIDLSGSNIPATKDMRDSLSWALIGMILEA
jgi:hypothetical protein